MFAPGVRPCICRHFVWRVVGLFVVALPCQLSGFGREWPLPRKCASGGLTAKITGLNFQQEYEISSRI